MGSGEHPPGSRLPPEAELAARADVSRLTLREAVKVLRDKGVLRVEQGRGTFVNPPQRWSALDPELLTARAALEGGGLLAPHLVEARSVVEVGTVALAAQRRTPEDLDRLARIVDRMRAAHQAADVPAFSVADRAFHDSLLQAAANPLLAALFEPILTLVHRVRVSTSHDPRAREKAIVAHSAILQAVAARDEQAAQQAMSAHVYETHATASEGPVEPAPGDQLLAAAAPPPPRHPHRTDRRPGGPPLRRRTRDQEHP